MHVGLTRKGRRGPAAALKLIIAVSSLVYWLNVPSEIYTQHMFTTRVP